MPKRHLNKEDALEVCKYLRNLKNNSLINALH